MSESLSSVSLKDVERIVTAKPLQVSQLVKVGLYFLLFVGIAAFAFGILKGNAQTTWLSVHVNFVYWFCVAAAASGFSAVFHICNAQWARPLKRIFESSSTFLLYSLIPFVALYFFGKGFIFEWTHETIAGKGAWLSPNFVYARDFIGALLLIFVLKKSIFLSISRDIGAIRGGLTSLPAKDIERWSDVRYNKYVQGWSSNTKAEIANVTSRLGRLSPVVIIVYAIVMSLIAFDQVMSVDAHWFSTLFGAFIFMSAVYMAVAWVSIGLGYIRASHPLFKAKVERRTLHDLGKLLFGFGIFWAYLFWSHYITIWYANLPEETGWIITRLRLQPWHDFAWIVLGMSFIIPFFLGLSRDVKQIPALLSMTAIIAAVGIWLQTYLLVVPTLFPHHIPLSWIDLAISLGFMSAFLLSCISFLSRAPLIPFGDLY